MFKVWAGSHGVSKVTWELHPLVTDAQPKLADKLSGIQDSDLLPSIGDPVQLKSKIDETLAVLSETLLPRHISIVNMSGSIITLIIEARTTILSVKCMVREKEGVYARHQQLMFNHMVLDDPQRTLEQYGIPTQATLTLVVQEPKPLTLEQLSLVPWIVQRQMISEKLLLLVAEFHFELAGQITGMMLDLDHRDLLVIMGDVKQLKSKVDEAVAVLYQASMRQISIVSMGGSTISLDVEARSTVLSVKTILRKKEGISVQRQQLIFNDAQLDDPLRTLEQYGIPTQATLTLVVQEPEPMTWEQISHVPPSWQKQLIGEALFPLVANVHPELAGKITGMLLEMNNWDLVTLTGDLEQLNSKIDEALALLH